MYCCACNVVEKPRTAIAAAMPIEMRENIVEVIFASWPRIFSAPRLMCKRHANIATEVENGRRRSADTQHGNAAAWYLADSGWYWHDGAAAGAGNRERRHRAARRDSDSDRALAPAIRVHRLREGGMTPGQ